ncbi:GNAT family N-acetyltransferase [Pseudonocardia bannensis]|uniref:GNAT family N-acetyltransferase n=1 Tax=Pseudonocardia bannensis TaxID=630973 RepID=A0A848DES5_9PSEU|nr:GNAT family N-acetyltransferase [Pseudonocardia bannensis]NMH91086.1 GNAT family N-acetyltransferase [Pseudonocardia bannensis]
MSVAERRDRSRPETGRVDARPVRALLADGTVVRMRELAGADAPLIGALYRGLPPYDRYLRFFSAGVSPSADALVPRAGPGSVSVGAFHGEELIGVAQCVAVGDGSVAEVALAVAHPQQAHGVGTLLLEHLASRARRRGVRRFVAEVLAENTPVRRVLTDIGLRTRMHAEDGCLHVELGLDPDEGYLAALAEREERAEIASLTAVLAPRSVVVVGASRRPDSVGHAVLAGIVAAGFTGRLEAVNPHAAQVSGVACYRSVTELLEPPDLAVLCVPAAAVPQVAEECGRRGARALLVITSGLSTDPPLATGLIDAVRRFDMRLVGPNCLGIANTDPAVRLDAGFAGTAPVGDVGLVTQSGGVAIAVQDELRRLGAGVSTMVSTGDKYDVSGNDLLLWWHGDLRTRTAVLYLESFGNPRKFSRLARRLAERIPVLTLRSGSSEAGQRAAASHTAATATPRVTRDALFRQAGVLAVDRLDQLSELIATLSWQPLPAGHRVAVISNAGGAGVLAADACTSAGLVVPPLAERTRQALRRPLPAHAATGNPVDTSAAATPEMFAAAVTALLASSDVDAVVALTVPTALADPFPGIARAANEALTGDSDKPLLAVRLAQAEHLTALPGTRPGLRVPCFAEPAAAATSLAYAAERFRWLARPRSTDPALTDIDPIRAAGVVTGFLDGHPDGGWLEPEQVQDVLEAFRLPILRGVVVEGTDDAVAAFSRAGRPVALKAVADDVLHKAAAGGVRLGLDSADAVRQAAEDLVDRFGTRLRGLLVQPMASPGVELLVGVTNDPAFGPLVAVGLGGTITDLAVDRTHRLAPLSDADAEEMLGEFHAGERLFDPRHVPAVNRSAVRDVIVRVARLAELLTEVVELDLNPVVVGLNRCVTVDARIRLAPPPSGDPALRALRI